MRQRPGIVVVIEFTDLRTEVGEGAFGRGILDTVNGHGTAGATAVRVTFSDVVGGFDSTDRADITGPIGDGDAAAGAKGADAYASRIGIT